MATGSKRYLPLRDGILDPKHRAIWPSLFFYLYLIQKVDWHTGIIAKYSHVAAAQDLGCTRGKIRYHYTKLVKQGYVKMLGQVRDTISLEIVKWRSLKDGYGPALAEGVSEPDTLEREGANLVDTQGVSEPDTQKPRVLTSQPQGASLVDTSSDLFQIKKGPDVGPEERAAAAVLLQQSSGQVSPQRDEVLAEVMKMIENNLGTFGSFVYDDIREDTLKWRNLDMWEYSVKQAALAGVKSYNYVRVVMSRVVEEGIPRDSGGTNLMERKAIDCWRRNGQDCPHEDYPEPFCGQCPIVDHELRRRLEDAEVE